MHRLPYAAYGLLLLCPVEFHFQTVRIKSYRASVDNSQCSDPFRSFEARSKMECAVLCAQNADCKTFHYSREGKVCYHTQGAAQEAAKLYYDRSTTEDCWRKGYVPHRGLCMKYNQTKLTYDAASAVCNDDGGHLLTIPDMDVLNYLIKSCGRGGHPWIDGKGGLTYDGKPLPWALWHTTGTPSGGACIGLCPSQRAMEVKPCNNIAPFVCQIEI